MKPLLKQELSSFTKRFENFRDAEFRSLEIISPTQAKLIFALQDSARAFDWITLELEFFGIENARFLQDNQLSLVDMSSGASILHLNNNFAFGIGECKNKEGVLNSTCYIICSSLKYQEGLF